MIKDHHPPHEHEEGGDGTEPETLQHKQDPSSDNIITAAAVANDQSKSKKNDDTPKYNATTNTHRPSKRKRKKNSGNDDDGHVIDPLFNDSTTVDDLSSVDVSVYLAWVNQQADALPSVFVAEPKREKNRDKPPAEANGGTNDDLSAAGTSITTTGAGENKDGPVIDGSMATLQVFLSKRMDILPPPSARHLPPPCANGSSHSHEWVSSTVANFSKLRSYLEREHAEKKQRQRQQNKLTQRKIVVPRMKDRAAWHVFCLGRAEAFGNAGGYYEGSDDDDGGTVPWGDAEVQDGTASVVDNEATEVHDALPASSSTAVVVSSPNIHPPPKPLYDPAATPLAGHPPTTALLLQIDQVLTRTLFHHHVHYLCEWKFALSSARCAWMYALLARLEKPWHREECCGVRRVLRECCARRWALAPPRARVCPEESPPEKQSKTQAGDQSTHNIDEGHVKTWEQLALLNTLIAVTGIYYEQAAFAGGDGLHSLFTVATPTS